MATEKGKQKLDGLNHAVRRVRGLRVDLESAKERVARLGDDLKRNERVLMERLNDACGIGSSYVFPPEANRLIMDNGAIVSLERGTNDRIVGFMIATATEVKDIADIRTKEKEGNAD